MGEMLTGLIEIILELFMWEKIVESLKERRAKRKIRHFRKKYGWFDELYRKENYAEIINHDQTVKSLLLNKQFQQEIGSDENERKRFINIIQNISRIGKML